MVIISASVKYIDMRSTHYTDVIMTTIASQITSITVVYSTVYPDADQRKHQGSASLAFVWGIHRDQWIPRIKGQLRGKCFIWWRHDDRRIQCIKIKDKLWGRPSIAMFFFILEGSPTIVNYVYHVPVVNMNWWHTKFPSMYSLLVRIWNIFL